MKEFKVLQIIDSLSAGGAESMVVNLTNALPESNIETFLCVTRKEGPLINNIKNKTKYLFLKRTKILDIKSFKRLKKFVNDNGITVVHTHTTSSFIGFVIKLITKNTILIWHNHTGAYTELKGMKLWTLKLISYYFDTVLNVSKALNNWTLKKLNSKKCFYIPNFADFSDDNKVTKLKGIRGKRVVCVAALRQEKDHLTLLKAFKKLLTQFPDWTLHLVGKDYKDSYANAIHSFIESNNLEKSIFIYDVRSDIKYILSQATIGVLSSKSEGMPVSLLEYGLAKLPVICTNVGACASVIKHESSGYIVPPENYEKLAFYLTKLATSKENQIKFGINLNKDVKSNYSKEAVIKSIIKIYSNCISM